MVAVGTIAMLIAVWNYWTINAYLEASTVALDVPRGLKLRWTYAYVLAIALVVIGAITFLFMLKVI